MLKAQTTLAAKAKQRRLEAVEQAVGRSSEGGAAKPASFRTAPLGVQINIPGAVLPGGDKYALGVVGGPLQRTQTAPSRMSLSHDMELEEQP